MSAPRSPRPQAPRAPQAPPRRAELSDAAVVSRSWGMAFATLVSRITGFLRIVLLAAILGAALSSSFTVANQLPNMVAALVLEATFTAIFVPVLARAERDDADGGAAFVRRLVTLATALLLLTTVLSVAAAPLLVRLMLGSDPQVNEPLTTAFAYLLLPQIIFYGLTAVYMAILNNRNVFGPPAWAPVLNNVVAIITLGVYVLVPGELSIDPVEMGNAKLLVLGIGTTLGVVAQAGILLYSLRQHRVDLRPLWGIDDRLKKFGTMAVAMMLYVLISQIGLIVGNEIASHAAASGPAIYNYAWLLLQLPFGMIGVTVLTVVMPRLSRNAAANDNPAVLADFSLATRLTMVTLIPIVAFMTVGGPAIGSALFAYGNFGATDAGYLGMAITLSAFTLIPYSMLLLELRVFYAREQPWIPIVLIVVITVVKIAGSLIAPHLTDDRELVAGYLGLANGLGFLAGATVGYVLLRSALRPPRGRMIELPVIRTILVTVCASLGSGLLAYLADKLLGFERLTEHGGAAGSLLRLVLLGVIMLPVIVTVLVAAKVPDALAAVAFVKRRLGRGGPAPTPAVQVSSAVPDSGRTSVPYPGHGISSPVPPRPGASATGGAYRGSGTTGGLRKGFAVTDAPADQGSAPISDTSGGSDDVALRAGAVVADGRYRLLVFHGGPPDLQFWHALDIALDRQVALTFIDHDGELPQSMVQEILTRTSKLSHIEGPGLARILDVTRLGHGGLVVSEWIRGGSLAEVAATEPSPMGGARAIQSLASTAESAHRAGVALSIDHPGRIRVSIEGDVVLAFPGTLPSATPEDDIRGVGATLYALLVNRWPLPESGALSGMLPATQNSAGQPVEPRAVDGTIPFQISAAAARAVQEGGGIRSAPTLLNLLQQATTVADTTELLEPVDSSQGPDSEDAAELEAAAKRRKALLIGVGVGGAILLVALLVLASVLKGIFGDVGGGLDKQQLGLNSQRPTTSGAPTPGSVVKPVGVTVFSPGGGADSPETAGKAITGASGDAWSTDVYTDPTPFPGFKSGVGLMLNLPQATTVASVSLNLTSTGTAIQIRSAQSANPSSLDATTVLTQPATMKTGSNTITISNAQPTQHLLIWISTLGTVDGKSKTDISNVVVKAAA
ncbi:murein biosynthesis integral membrane protein MurJ [Mycolicibacterium mucogenicum]|uniref:Murein biosynthesis integral membrane protein MurJ n=2 Tax=Mycolicibacterium mucogenicum DSM 44124 TaxID=1226753 RepID=A0A8E4R7Z5_MYCMU|nr:murein biosynthesis integral membrane protein MurJ [Mycolicibacterium mucogenicum]KAB7760531.1 membrane protein [Mycolicibacterium mucogenicum DSM 44124]QPG69461.1 murein biosynthesis integral membrane protein MurJ [Mycolicibacterium mucogenicum DSM 44124]